MLQTCSSLFPIPLCVTPCWEHDAAMRRPAPRSQEWRKGDEKPTNWVAMPETKSPSLQGKQKEFSKIERTTHECL
jgi:hypothetical protein